MDATDDAELLAAWADTSAPIGRRESAFRQLVATHHHRVFAVCLRELHSREDAEDATQDTFAKAARAAAGFRGHSAVSTWLYRIAVNACRDIQRQHARRPAHPVADIHAVAAVRGDHADDIGQHVEWLDTTAAIRGAIDRLDDLSRAIVMACLVRGAPYRDASSSLGIPLGTVKSRIHRARASMARAVAASTP